jgi:AcrR family transcriptional regulator
VRSPRTLGRDQDRDTRARLLDAAAGTFAEHGFAAATVREVCRRAGANVAAVNYHFGSKEQLYLETLRAVRPQLKDEHLALAALPEPRTRAEARERFRTVVLAFARRMIGEGADRHTRILRHELAEPTFALDFVVKEFMAPRFELLKNAIRPFLDRAAGDEVAERALALHAQSILGQILYHRIGGPIALRLLGARSYGPDLTAEIVEHVTRFSERALGIAAGQRKAQEKTQ